MASDTTLTASFWPTTLLCSWSSRFMSLSLSVWLSFSAGIPVHMEMTVAMSSTVTSSRRSRWPPAVSSLYLSSWSRSCLSKSGSVSNRSSAARLRSKSRSALSISTLTTSILSLRALIMSTRDFSLLHASVREPCSAFSLSIWLSMLRSRSSSCSSSRVRFPSPVIEIFSISSWMSFLSISSSCTGLLVTAILSLAAASSTRSMALSGRNRSLMYLWLSWAAATRAESRMRTPWCTS
mmetsp:Transcript_35302/g.87704  ORF Transcript_35302/g.87704 Transcript_35302/m.87704 type:complete len:237 (-) Transcript_35302:195-905(-)